MLLNEANAIPRTKSIMSGVDITIRPVSHVVTGLLSLGILFAPAILLGVTAAWTTSLPLAVGVLVQVVYALVFLKRHPVWHPSTAPSIIILYLIALGWCWLVERVRPHPVLPFVQGVLTLGAVGLFALHHLLSSGAESLRKAMRATQRIQARRQWPENLLDCRSLRDVIRLRASLDRSAVPALALLQDPRPEVQAAALGALEYRPFWRPGEVEFVLKVGTASLEPSVRALTAYALAGVQSEDHIAQLASMLRDPSAEVRRAAAEALLWDGDRRWPLAREAIHAALADTRQKYDGPLFLGPVHLSELAINDLTQWAAERPPIAGRAIDILIDHYHRILSSGDQPEFAHHLAQQMLSADIAPALRTELAELLRDHQLLTPELLDRLTNADQPGPLRLLAAEVMLRNNPNDSDGLDVLRGLARQPNREMALAVGAILQNVLNLPIGLPADGELPAAGSKMAADVAKRVLAWANGSPLDQISQPTPRPMSGLKPKTHPPRPGLEPRPYPPEHHRRHRDSHGHGL